MRSIGLAVLSLGLAVGCSNDVDPRVIPGGGVGDGEIDGELNVHVIDNQTDAPVGNATVRVGTTEKTTDEKGLAVFADLEGPQTIAIKASGYRSTVWVGINGANTTVPITLLGSATPDQATLSGGIAGWDTISVATGHAKAAIVLYSQTDDLGDDANNIPTPAMGNICFGPTCAWRLASRTGAVTVIAAIIDRDFKGTVAETDDTNTIIGWAYKTDVRVEDGVDQSGIMLTLVEAGNLQNVSVDLGTPPAGLPTTNSLVGIEVGDDEVIQLPLFLQQDTDMLLAPKPTVFGADATYRLTAIAQTASGGLGAQSIVLRQRQTAPALAAGEWLVPPTGVTISRTSAAFTEVETATLHQVQWDDSTGQTILEITTFDGSTAVDVPALVALPASGALQARASGIGVDFDVHEFSLEADGDLLWGIASEPVSIP